jgi:transketolase
VRTSFIDTLTELAGTDPRIWLMVGDLGFSVIERFADRYPDQFVNAGVAEQNMLGIATGMALNGKIVFTYSISTFTTLRCLEQIRNDVCYHRANVKIVGVGGGLAYGVLGPSHHATEDLAIMRSMPNMRVVAPGDPVEAAWATAALARSPGPAYLRLGKAGDPHVHEETTSTLELGRATYVKQGRDAVLIATGSMLPAAVAAATRLVEEDVQVGVISMHCIKPLDVSAVTEAARSTRLIVTVEEHSLVGGLGSAVAEVVSTLIGPRATLRCMGLPNDFMYRVGSQDYLRRQHGLTVEDIAAGVRNGLEEVDGLAR